MNELLRTISFENGLKLSFFDQTNRYFGDFYRVFILVSGGISPQAPDLSQEQLPRDSLSDSLSFEKKLERMGVAGPDLAQVKQALIDDFLRTAGGYLSSPEFPEQLAKSKLTKNTKGRFQPFQLRRELP